MVVESFFVFLARVMVFSSYVNNSTSFENPLSEEEERDYLIKMKSGDKHAKEMLIKHNMRLVAHVVKKFSNAGEADDLISVGCIGLIKAINTFELDKGSQLSTYAARCIENEILMLIRINKKHKNVVSLNQPIGIDKEGNELTIRDCITDTEHDVSKEVEDKLATTKIIEFMQKNLSKREFEIMCYRFGLLNYPLLTQREIAVKLGISRSYISRLETKAIGIIKENFNEF